MSVAAAFLYLIGASCVDIIPKPIPRTGVRIKITETVRPDGTKIREKVTMNPDGTTRTETMIEWRSGDDPEQPSRDGDKAVTEPVQQDEAKVREKVTTNPDASDDAEQPYAMETKQLPKLSPSLSNPS